MSHVATIDLEINDLEALEKAAVALGLELVRDQKQYHWFGTHVGDYPVPVGFKKEDLGKCDHTLRVKGADQTKWNRPYEVGVVKNKDKAGYTLLWDFYCGGYGLQEKIGKDGGKLKQGYAVEVARKHIPKGYQIHQKVKQDGTIVLEATR